MSTWLDTLLNDGTSHFSAAGTTGSMAASASTQLAWYCRYTGSNNAIVRRVTLDGMIATTAFAVGQILAQLKFARGFSAENGTPGGSALTISKPNQLLKSGQQGSGMGVIRFAGTGPIAAPTWTLDSNPIGQLNTHSSAGFAAATPIIGSVYLPKNGVLWDANQQNDYPCILQNNEGLALNMTVPGTGVWILGVTIEWDEMDGVRFSA